METSRSPTVAFFGATGDCAGYCLAESLKASHRCVALARNPAKLTASMKAKGVSGPHLNGLRIIQGDIRDQRAVEDALHVNGEVVNIVVSSVGSVPTMRWSLMSPIDTIDPTLCGDAATVLVAALRNLKPVSKPLLIVVSTTGLTTGNQPRDVPLVYVPLYHWLLHVPHLDKAHMEATIRRAAAGSPETRSISSFVAVRPTLLMDGPSRSIDRLRAGTDEDPALGYTIRRSEVGKWMYENMIAKEPKQEYRGKGVSLTA